MKAFTSLEQSRKLAKILPVESADQTWMKNVFADANFDIPEEMQYKHGDIPFQNYDGIGTPCWSLAALLGIIPKEVEIKGQKYTPCLFPIIDGHWLYKLWYNSNEIIESPIGVWHDNPIDACYKMILKLHEQKLL